MIMMIFILFSGMKHTDCWAQTAWTQTSRDIDNDNICVNDVDDGDDDNDDLESCSQEWSMLSTEKPWYW